MPPKAFDSEKPASQRDAVSVGPVPSNSPAQSVTAARGSDAATPNPEGRGTAARTYASAVSRTTIDSSVSADADVLIAKTAKHEQKASIPLGNFDREGFRAPVLVIRGLEWDVVDRLIRSGSAVLWIELNAGAGQLVFDKNGLRELSGPVSDQEFAERRFDLSAVKDIRIRGAAALAGFAASFNVSKSALSLARFQLLIRAPLDEQFLAEQQAFAERNGLTLTQINRTEGLIDFDPDGYPVFRVVRATGADGKVIP
ncbi:MAG TPA: hypothetical protein VHD56_02495 [Tepidisphaeraceae bacterium]|nr:hypothetical protein [Tepidisphaeraceae bacterium]